MKPRIWVDFNNAGGMNEVWLNSRGTLWDLSFQKLKLYEGMQVIAWDAFDESQDFEMDAIVVLKNDSKNPAIKYWVAQSIGNLGRCVIANERKVIPKVCYHCSLPYSDIEEVLKAGYCRACGGNINEPWLIPQEQ